jgi:hypothetical protein
MICHDCGASLQPSGKIGRQEMCPKCGAALHCCLNCRFYAESAFHQCREEQAEFVNDKTGANFCDYFQVSESIPAKTDSRREEAKKKLDDLFKK